MGGRDADPLNALATGLARPFGRFWIKVGHPHCALLREALVPRGGPPVPMALLYATLTSELERLKLRLPIAHGLVSWYADLPWACLWLKCL